MLKGLLLIVMAPARDQSGGMKIKSDKNMGWEQRGRGRGRGRAELKCAKLKVYMAFVERVLYVRRG